MGFFVEDGKSLNYKISFEVDGNLVTPSSAAFTLKKNDGTVVGGLNEDPITIPSLATSVTYTVSGANNTATLDYELRYIEVKFVYSSKTYYIRDFYALKESLNLPVTYNDVRALVGLAQSELPDDQIDLFMAYSQLQEDVTEATLDTLISSGSSLIPYLQIGLKAKAALNSLVMIESMVFQSEQADNTLYKRFSKVDFQAALDRLTSMYNNAVAKLNGVTQGNSLSVTPFNVVTGTDPVTNE